MFKSMMLTLITMGLMISKVSKAEDSSLTRPLQATLPYIQIDPTSDLAHTKILNGDLTIDKNEGLITLVFHPAMKTCPPGLFCTMEMPADIIFEIPLTSALSNRCGVATYKGLYDKTRVDGARYEIIISDRTQDICRSNPQTPPGSIFGQIRVYNPWTGKTDLHRFLGKVIPNSNF